MKSIFISLFIFLSIFFFGCQDQNKKTLTINPTFSELPLKINSIAKSIDVIEVKTKVPIGSAITFLANNKHIYLFDKDQSQRLYQLDYSGNVINFLQLGEDDRLNIHGITNLIIEESKIGIISRGQQINWFDEKLKKIGEERIPVKGKFHYPYKNGFVTQNSSINESENWDFFYSENDIINRSIPYDKESYQFTYEATSPFSYWREGILYTKIFNDSIYYFNDNEILIPTISIDFGKNSPPKDFLKTFKSPMDLYAFFKSGKFTYLKGSVYGLANNSVLLEISDNKQSKLGIWSTDQNTIKIYPGILDSSVTGLEFYNPTLLYQDKLFFGYSGDYLKSKEGQMNTIFKSELSDVYENSYFIFILHLIDRE